ncbi:MAG: hypothetical protein KatS3mg015_2476 [Fimbriimonadales bacterium]|nr:MAG: hypothetical protein KatS3mg015_2476 [Fimbriimonadales bacterium]
MIDWVPPRHGEEEYWSWTEPVALCPLCGCLLRAEVLDHFQRGPWKCDIHGEVTPEWTWIDDDDEAD